MAADESAVLDIADASCSDGRPLPPLALEGCVFPKAILMSGALLRRLSLKGSRLLTLSADGMHVHGPVDLTGVRSVEGSEQRPNPHFVPADPARPFTGAPRPRVVRSFAQPDEKSEATEPSASKDSQPAEEVSAAVELQSPAPESPVDPRSSASAVHEPASLLPETPDLPAPGGSPEPKTEIPEKKSAPIFDQQGLCWVQMRNCTIEDILDASGAEFVAPPLCIEAWDSPLARYAFDLAGTTIEGRLWCMSGFVAVGGLTIDNCRISGTVWLSGANVVAVEWYAFCATGVKIAQDLILDYVSPVGESNAPFRAQGVVYLDRINIGGRLFMRCAELFPDCTEALVRQAENQSGIVARGCRIGHDVLMTGPIHADWWPFYCEGDIDFRKAAVGSRLMMSGAMIRGDVSYRRHHWVRCEL